MKVEYDKKIEVTKTQFLYLRKYYAGLIAYRDENGKYYIKVWHTRFAKEIEKYLEK